MSHSLGVGKQIFSSASFLWQKKNGEKLRLNVDYSLCRLFKYLGNHRVLDRERQMKIALKFLCVRHVGTKTRFNCGKKRIITSQILVFAQNFSFFKGFGTDF